MTARLHRVADAPAFRPEGHTGVSPVRLTGTAPEETISVVLSNYEPGQLCPVVNLIIHLPRPSHPRLLLPNPRTAIRHGIYPVPRLPSH